MITFCIIAFIGSFISVVSALFYSDDIIDGVKKLLGGVVLTVFAAFAGTWAISISLMESGEIIDLGVREVRYPIKSIEDKHSDSFILGYDGFSLSPSYYYFYYELPTGGYKLGSVNTEKAIILEWHIPMWIRRYKQTKTADSNWL